MYEILEHLDYLKLSELLTNLSKILNKDGVFLISLPKQQLQENLEHLWSPSEYLINKFLSDFKMKNNNKFTSFVQWVPLENHGIPGNWFIRLTKLND